MVHWKKGTLMGSPVSGKALRSQWRSKKTGFGSLMLQRCPSGAPGVSLSSDIALTILLFVCFFSANLVCSFAG